MPSRGSASGLVHAAYHGVCLGPADAAAGGALSTAAGWNQSEADWKFLLGAGAGFGFETGAGELVASTVVMPYGGGLAWIGMVLVAEAARRQGLATALMKRAIAWCSARNLVPLLDATAAGREVYTALEFNDLRPITRWKGGARSPNAPDELSGCETVPSAASASPERAPPPIQLLSDLAYWQAWDRPRFGADRGALLRWLFLSRPDAALEIPGRGYCLGRSGRTARQVGPLVAATERDAISLIRRALHLAGGPVIVDVPAGRADFERELRACGLEPSRELVRMGWRTRGEFGRPESIYALAGLELG